MLLLVLAIFGSGSLFTMLLIPIAPDLLIQLIFTSVPAILFIFCVAWANFRIYGPLTGQRFFGISFDEDMYEYGVYFYVVLWVILLIAYSEIRRTWHIFYMRSLRKNFFCGGKDSDFIDQLDQPFCPFIIMTGTVNDFRYLNDKSSQGPDSSISEISFSPLHMGGEATGYARMPRYNTLAKCTALTGAGCLDAITLSMSSDIRYRFWLTLLDLCWGDYVLFLPTEKFFQARIRKWCGHRLARAMKDNRFMDWLLHRIPEIFTCVCCMALFVVGFQMAHTTDYQQCQVAFGFVSTSLILVTVMMALSFFAFSRGLRWWMFSPFLRQYHQLTRYTYEGWKPPGALYVTDGGVQDCTGVLQLLRRRCPRILLAFAGADPNDELGVVRVMLRAATDKKFASFFDPREPRRDLHHLLAEFRDDKEMMYLHIGVLYPPDVDLAEKATAGKLILFKNRLPPSWTEEDNPWRFEIQELLSEHEIRSGAVPPSCRQGDDPLFDLYPEELGGIGCCDCCHRRGWNCGPKFPNLGGLNYLTLSPQLFNCSVRLGRAVAPAAIVELFRREQKKTITPNQGRKWRSTIKSSLLAARGFKLLQARNADGAGSPLSEQ